ncbi:hypothetical protein CI610_01895 [invertebrate metagenome]|uniref:Uncharacterized protein n=1 Tax=invertebrate metagenome TaxID=1711999 RepID=A0A2H9T7E9_9ZZZZ
MCFYLTGHSTVLLCAGLSFYTLPYFEESGYITNESYINRFVSLADQTAVFVTEKDNGIIKVSSIYQIPLFKCLPELSVEEFNVYNDFFENLEALKSVYKLYVMIMGFLKNYSNINHQFINQLINYHEGCW